MEKMTSGKHSHMERSVSLIDEMRVESTKKLPINNNILTGLYSYISIILVILILSRKDGYGFRGISDETSMDTTLSIQKALKNPDIESALHAVCTHLDGEEQAPIHTFTGALQIVNNLQKFLENANRIQGPPYSKPSNKIEKQ